MADVRSMLRAERVSRRITHPHAAYTSDGKLLCNLCETLIKAETHWQAHLHSTQHTLRLQRQRDAVHSRQGETGGRKRKADTQDGPESPPDERKRARPETPGEVDGDDDSTVTKARADTHANDGPKSSNGTLQTNGGVDRMVPAEDVATNEAELAALESELASLEQETVQASADARVVISENATISAAPKTAEELAAEAREASNAQRGKRQAELEAEREDAARGLEAEFDEMESLEERLRRLKEKREALRKACGENDIVSQRENEETTERAREGNSEMDSSDEDEFDDWGFGAS